MAKKINETIREWPDDSLLNESSRVSDSSLVF